MAGVCDLETARALADWVAEGVERLERQVSRDPGSADLAVVHLSRDITELSPEAPYPAGASWREALAATFDHQHAEELAAIRQAREAKAPLTPEQDRLLARRALWRELAAELEPVLRRQGDWLIPPERLWGDPETRAVFQRAIALGDRDQALTVLRDWLAGQGYAYRAALLGRPGLATGLLAAFGWVDRPQAAPALLFEETAARTPMSREAADQLLAVIEEPEAFPRLAARLNDLVGEANRVTDRLELLWRTVGPIVAKYSHGVPNRLTTAEIYTWLWPKLTDEEKAVVSQALRRSGFPETPDEVAEVGLELRRALAKDVEDQLAALPVRFKVLRSALAPLRATDRIMGLLRIAFLLENTLEAWVKQSLAGRSEGGARAMLAEQQAYTRALVHQLHYPISAEALRDAMPQTQLDRLLARTGVEQTPEAVAATWERLYAQPELTVFSPHTAPIWDMPLVRRLAGPPPPEPEARRLASFLGVDLGRGRPRWWQYPARAVVMPIAHVMAWVRVLATAQEAAFRKQAFAGRVVEFLQQGGEAAWEQRARELFRLHLLPEAEADRYLDAFDGLLERGPAAAYQLSRRLFPHEPTLARQLGYARRQLLRQAEEEGIREANRIHFDYLHKTRLDEVAGELLKYHTWATRNLVFYVEEMARHAALYRLFGRSLALGQAEADAGERPANAAEMVDLGEGGPWGLVFGPRARFYLSLWALIGLFSQLEADPTPRRGTVYDQLTGALQPIGLTPNLDIRLLASLLGYSTTGDPPRTNPYTGAMARATGVDLTYPMTEAVRRLRGLLSGRLPGSQYVAPETLTGSVSFDRSVWRELIAMSVEETGRVERRYLVAMADPDDPLFQQAMVRVARRRGPLEVFNLTSPIRGQVASPSEQELAQSLAEEWPEGQAFALAAARGDPQIWLMHLPHDLREAQIKAGFALTQELKQQGRLPHPDYLAGRLPWFVAYQAWAARQDPGERSVNRFLREHRSLPVP